MRERCVSRSNRLSVLCVTIRGKCYAMHDMRNTVVCCTYGKGKAKLRRTDFRSTYGYIPDRRCVGVSLRVRMRGTEGISNIKLAARPLKKLRLLTTGASFTVEEGQHLRLQAW